MYNSWKMKHNFTLPYVKLNSREQCLT